ncbi:hypothetical protein J2X98_004373 [Pseudarthrobacter enclensis]|uniref:Uncharacterized protein n=1 Tax=Pseudarthrobacter enclensis TaxID=993070 RepID=A0ABT9S2P5_9MICC|nr:hypothetical protein [Pseudarthrobacter enclensis]
MSIRPLWVADGPDQSVEKPPGPTSVTWILNPSPSCVSDWEKPSSAHFDAWYAPTVGKALIPPMLDT